MSERVSGFGHSYTVWSVLNSQPNDSHKLVIFSKSKAYSTNNIAQVTNKWLLFLVNQKPTVQPLLKQMTCEPVLFSKKNKHSVNSVDQFPNKSTQSPVKNI